MNKINNKFSKTSYVIKDEIKSKFDIDLSLGDIDSIMCFQNEYIRKKIDEGAEVRLPYIGSFVYRQQHDESIKQIVREHTDTAETYKKIKIAAYHIAVNRKSIRQMSTVIKFNKKTDDTLPETK